MITWIKTVGFKGLALRGVIGLAMIAYALVFGELFMRFMAPQAMLPRHVQAAPWGVRMNIPNAVYQHSTPDVAYQVRINGEGMRADREFTPQPAAGTCRIAMQGDSFFMGYEADLPDTFAGILERLLGEAGYRAEILNFAVSGFGTAEMVQTYEAQVRRYNPDILLVQWHSSDFKDNMRSRLFRLENDALVRSAERYLPGMKIRERLEEYPFYAWLNDSSHLYTGARQLAAAWVKTITVQTAAQTTSLPSPMLQETTQASDGVDPAIAEKRRMHARRAPLSAAILRAFHGDVTGHGTRFLVIDTPNLTLDKSRYLSPLSFFPEGAIAPVPAISALKRFEEGHAAGQDLTYAHGHLHFTPEGNRIWAAHTAEALKTRGWLDACATR